jgi:hypothetical protein
MNPSQFRQNIEKEMEISESWSIVLSNETNGNLSESDLCRAWFPLRAKENRTCASPLWYMSAYFVKFPTLSWRSVAGTAFGIETLVWHLKGLKNL